MSLTTDSRGHKKIISAEVADREWAANTRRTSVNFTEPDDDEYDPGEFDTNDPNAHLPYAEAMRRREIENWLLAKVKRESSVLDLEVKRGELIPSAEAREVVFDAFTVVRTKLLGVPSRCRQRIPGLKSQEVQVIEDLIREALEELADGELADGNG